MIKEIQKKADSSALSQMALRVFKEALDNATDAIGMSTPQGRHYYQNKSFTDLFGIIGENPPATLYCDEKVGKEVFRTIMDGGTWTGEVAMYARDRRILSILLRAYAIKDEQGSFIGLVGIHTDISERRCAEDALKFSEATYREIFNTVNDTIWIHDVDTFKFIDVNSKVTEMFGYSVREALGLSVEDISSGVPPFTPETAVTLLRKAAAGEPQLFEWHTRHKDGHLFWTEVSLKRGTVAGRACLLAIERDITKRKRAEEALAEKSNFQRVLGEISNEFINTPSSGIDEGINRTLKMAGLFAEADRSYVIMFDFIARKIRNTHEWCRENIEPQIDNLQNVPIEMFSWVIDQLDGLKVVHIPQVANLPREAKKAKEELEAEDIQSLLLVPLVSESKCVGTVGFDFVSQAKHCSVNEIRLLKMAGTTISNALDRRQAEKALLESEERYRSLVENTLDGYFIAEIPSGQFSFLNRRICDLFGYSIQEGLSLTLWDITDLNEHKIIKERIQARLEDQKPDNTSNIYNTVRKDGSTFRAEVSYSLVTYHGIPAVQGTLRDVTEKEKLLHQLYQAQKMESVGRLAGGVAHDFNNMLSVIIGHAELVMEDTDPSSPMYDDLNEIYKASHRSSELTRQLLAFARKQMAVPKVINVNDSVTGMLKMLQRLIGEDINLLWIPGDSPWLVKIDPAQIDQILANLCVNARDAISGVGKVTIETKNIVLDQAFCSEHTGSMPGNYVLIKVVDDGCGMDNSTLENLFEPFFTTKQIGEGTGLGLSTVYGIIKQNDGYIAVNSQPGKGTTFKVYLPQTRNSLEIKGKLEYGTIQKGSETVLLVEDEASVLRLAKSVLERIGYTVLEARTPAEAISITEKYEGSIHLLITDVIMPEMNGKELKTKVEKLKPNLKAIFMSGYTANVIMHRGILEDDVHFIPKPFSVKGFSVKVREVLDE